MRGVKSEGLISHCRYPDVIPSTDLVDHELSRVQPIGGRKKRVLLGLCRPMRRGRRQRQGGADNHTVLLITILQ